MRELWDYMGISRVTILILNHAPSWNTKPWPAGNPNFLMMISCYKMRTFHRLDSRGGHFILPHSRWKIMENPQWLSPLSYHRWLNFHRIPGLSAYHLQLRGHWCAVAAPWPRTGGTLDFLQFHPLQAPARKARSRHDLRCSRNHETSLSNGLNFNPVIVILGSKHPISKALSCSLFPSLSGHPAQKVLALIEFWPVILHIFYPSCSEKKHLKPMSFGRSGGNSLAKSPHCRHWTVSIAHRGQLVAAAIDVQRQARRAVDEAKGGHAAMPGPSGTQGDLLSPWPQSSYKIAQYNSKKRNRNVNSESSNREWLFWCLF